MNGHVSDRFGLLLQSVGNGKLIRRLNLESWGWHLMYVEELELDRHNALKVSCEPVHTQAQLHNAYEPRPSAAQLPHLLDSFTVPLCGARSPIARRLAR